MKVDTNTKRLSLISWLPVCCFLLVCWQKVGLWNTELTSGWIIMQPTLRRIEFASHFFPARKLNVLLKFFWNDTGRVNIDVTETSESISPAYEAVLCLSACSLRWEKFRSGLVLSGRKKIQTLKTLIQPMFLLFLCNFPWLIAEECVIDWWLEGWQLQAELTIAGRTAEGNKIKYSQRAKTKWKSD